MSKCLVLSAKSYDFENDKGERIQGTKLSYISKNISSREGEKGHPPMIVSLSNTLAKCFTDVPAIYDLDFEQVPGKNNKPETILTDATYVSPVDFSVFF